MKYHAKSINARHYAEATLLRWGYAPAKPQLTVPGQLG
jgi:hypothetical protein